jgi:hypothetical protein
MLTIEFDHTRYGMPIGISNEQLALLMAEAARLPVERQDEFLEAVAASYYASRTGMPTGLPDAELAQLMVEAARLPVEECGAFLVAVAARYYSSIDPGDIGRKTFIGEDTTTPGQCDSATGAQEAPVEGGPINGDAEGDAYDQWRDRHMGGAVTLASPPTRPRSA